MRTINAQGSYSIPKDFDNAGADVEFDFTFEVYEALDEAISQLGGKDKVLAMINQTHKEDCRNNASGKAKSENGHSTAKVMTPEEKEEAKAKRKENAEIIKVLATKGLTLADLLKM